MPKVVDKQAVRKKIVEAFRECLKEKPFDKVSLRDIAKQAGLPHTTILNYYDTKQEIVLAYVEEVADYTYRAGHRWLTEHHAAEFASPEEYIKAFLMFTKKDAPDISPVYTGALNIYASGQTNRELAAYVKEEQHLWNEENTKLICRELNLPDVNPLIGNYIFSCVQAVCMISYNGWFDEQSFDDLLSFYAETIVRNLS